MITRCRQDGTAGRDQRAMSDAILVDLREAVRSHPWWIARSNFTLALLGRLGVPAGARVLDAGCGWGVTLDALEGHAYDASGLDQSDAILEVLDRPGRRLILADLSKPLDGLDSYDVVLALDVIEHLDDDRAAVNHLSTLVRPGGCLIVSVPALPALFSEFDAIQGHRRRYLPESLTAAFSEADLAPPALFWWGAWMVPLLTHQRRRPKDRPGDSVVRAYQRYLSLPRWPLSQIIRWGFATEHARALNGKLRTGTSLFAIAGKSLRKPLAESHPARVTDRHSCPPCVLPA